MQAIAYHEYGSPDVLRLEDFGTPVPADGQVLIRIRAASVNALDWHLMRGRPYLARLITGWPRPKTGRPGRDLAGRVEAIGRNVTMFRPGDEVFGVSLGGTFAELACADERKLVLKPAAITFEQAAAVPVAAITALQGLRDKGGMATGQRILINGAAGGVGTFAVQIAKAWGAEVTGVCSTRNLDMVRSIGADHVVDYTREDFTRNGRRYDVLFDVAGNRSLPDCRRVMNDGATHVLAGGPPSHVLKALALSPFARQKVVTFLASIKRDDLIVLKELMEAKKVTPVIDRCYPLREVPEAMRHVGAGHARGKVVITMGSTSEAA